MATVKIVKTNFLVLRKTAYSETSLIVAGISPHFGQLHFLVRGARRMDKKHFPTVDIFRVLEVVYTPSRSHLHTWKSADPLIDFAAVASRKSAFDTASWLARFALLNLAEQQECPRFHTALCSALQRLCQFAEDPARTPSAPAIATVGAAVVFLDENGLLPDYAGRPQQQAKRAALLELIHPDAKLPEISAENWARLMAWAIGLLKRGECQLPE